MDYIKELMEIEAGLFDQLSDFNGWKTLRIDYEKPYVNRMWKQIGDKRIMLHKLFPCSTEEAFWHPHPWPSAVKYMPMYGGMYETGFSVGKNRPVISRLVSHTPGYYEMTDPTGWHYVKPINEPVLSIMLIGPVYEGFTSPETRKLDLRPLDEGEHVDLWESFRRVMCHENYTPLNEYTGNLPKNYFTFELPDEDK